MSKKPKQSRHRVPALSMSSESVDQKYQAEVDASIAHLEKRYAKAHKALEAAEAKAERARLQAERLAEQQAAAERAAQKRLEEEARLGEYIALIKQAAKDARVEEARSELERKHREALARRNAQTVQRKADLKAIRDRREEIAKSRNNYRQLESMAAEHRREVREIELLMMPGNYAGRSHRGRISAQHHSGRNP